MPAADGTARAVDDGAAGAAGAADDRGEEVLTGGLANVGKVVRVGDTVRRPLAPHTTTVNALLDHLARAGFRGAPRPHGIDDLGRAVLDFVPGDVGNPPYPAWTASPELLVSVARLQRAMHDAAAGFVEPADARWERTLAPESGDGQRCVVGHNDLCVENVVVRDGRAIAFIDFDFAAPVDHRWDVAVAIRHWAPVADPADLVGDAREGVDQIARFGAYCDAYGGLDRADRRMIADSIGAFLDHALPRMRERAEEGRPGYAEIWAGGYEGRNRRAAAWVRANAADLSGA